MSNQLSIESLDTLISAVEKYREELLKNKQILVNAADLCDQAMGSDAISQKHIVALNNAINDLDRTSRIVEDVAVELREDRRKAMETLED